MDEQPKVPARIADVVPSSAFSFEQQLSLDRERFAYLSERRDKLQDNFRLGVLGLNGASLIALFGLVSSSTGQAAASVGFSADRVAWSATAFVVGIGAAGLAWWVEATRSLVESGEAYERLGKASLVVGAMREPATTEKWDEYGEQMRAYHEAPLVGFQYSNVVLTAQSFAAGAWIMGAALPVAKLFGW